MIPAYSSYFDLFTVWRIPTYLRQRQDGACQRGLPLHRVHLQAAGVLNPGIVRPSTLPLLCQ